MSFLPEVRAGKIGLLIGPRAEREAMLRIAAALALRGAVHVLDAGNSFDAYRVARHIRRYTAQLPEALERISVARAFTCYQVLTLFEQTKATGTPQLVMDLLATFCDENVSQVESERLLKLVADHMRRLRNSGPVMVSIQYPRQAERHGLVHILQEMVDHVYTHETPTTPSSPRLF